MSLKRQRSSDGVTKIPPKFRHGADIMAVWTGRGDANPAWPGFMDAAES